jgi:hypothetical protein
MEGFDQGLAIIGELSLTPFCGTDSRLFLEYLQSADHQVKWLFVLNEINNCPVMLITSS